MKRPFLILSHHRSGSNFLNELIQYHNNFTSINEPLSMHTNIFREKDLIPWTMEEYNPEHFHIDLNEQPGVIEFMHELKKWLLNPTDYNIRGFKETLLFDKLGWLKEYLPTLKIIFLIRDPRAVITSVMKRNLYNSLWNYKETITNYIDNYMTEEFVNPENILELSTYSWKIRYQLAKQNCHLFDHIFIRLEDIMLDPIETLHKIMSFLENDIDTSQLAFIRQSSLRTLGGTFSSYRQSDDVLNSWRKVLTDDHQQYIQRKLREEMEGLKYL